MKWMHHLISQYSRATYVIRNYFVGYEAYKSAASDEKQRCIMLVNILTYKILLFNRDSTNSLDSTISYR